MKQSVSRYAVFRISLAAVSLLVTFFLTESIFLALLTGVIGYFAPRFPSWFNAWGWPFIWILLIPSVTLFWSAVLLDNVLDEDVCTLVKEGWHAGGEGHGPDVWRCPWEDAWPTLLPGLLNLVAFAWVLSGRREVRWAGLVAGTLSAVRLAAPLLIYRLSGAEIYGTTGTYWFGPNGSDSTGVSFLLWLLSAVSAIVFLVGANMVESRKRKQTATPVQGRAQDERAQLLAHLRDEGLITDEEYQSKRADLPSGP